MTQGHWARNYYRNMVETGTKKCPITPQNVEWGSSSVQWTVTIKGKPTRVFLCVKVLALCKTHCLNVAHALKRVPCSRFALTKLCGMELHMNMPLVRHFLRTSRCQDGDAVLQRACNDGEPGAVQLLLLALKVRSNRRTRRTFDVVRASLSRTTRPRWLSRLAKQLFSLYRVLSLLCAPVEHNPSSTLSLSRRQQRELSATGAVKVNRTTLAAAASDKAGKLWDPCFFCMDTLPDFKGKEHEKNLWEIVRWCCGWTTGTGKDTPLTQDQTVIRN